MIVKSYKKGDVELLVTRNDDIRLNDDNCYVAIQMISGTEPDYHSHLDLETAIELTDYWIDKIEGNDL